MMQEDSWPQLTNEWASCQFIMFAPLVLTVISQCKHETYQNYKVPLDLFFYHLFIFLTNSIIYHYPLKNEGYPFVFLLLLVNVQLANASHKSLSLSQTQGLSSGLYCEAFNISFTKQNTTSVWSEHKHVEWLNGCQHTMCYTLKWPTQRCFPSPL